MAQHSMMSSLVKTTGRQLKAGSMNASPVPKLDECAKLVDGKKMLHPIKQVFGNVTRIIAECFRGIARFPSTAIVLQGLWHIPVIEGGKWPDVVCEQFVNEMIVKIQAFRIWRTTALRKHARPRDRETIRFDPQRLHELNILFITMVVVIRDVTGGVVHHLTRGV